MYSEDDLFIRDDTPAIREGDYDPENVKNVRPVLMNGQEMLAGIPKEVADKLLNIVADTVKVLMGIDGVDKETACKKIRWATHVIENRD